MDLYTYLLWLFESVVSMATCGLWLLVIFLWKEKRRAYPLIKSTSRTFFLLPINSVQWHERVFQFKEAWMCNDRQLQLLLLESFADSGQHYGYVCFEIWKEEGVVFFFFLFNWKPKAWYMLYMVYSLYAGFPLQPTRPKLCFEIRSGVCGWFKVI